MQYVQLLTICNTGMAGASGLGVTSTASVASAASDSWSDNSCMLLRIFPSCAVIEETSEASLCCASRAASQACLACRKKNMKPSKVSFDMLAVQALCNGLEQLTRDPLVMKGKLAAPRYGKRTGSELSCGCQQQASALEQAEVPTGAACCKCSKRRPEPCSPQSHTSICLQILVNCRLMTQHRCLLLHQTVSAGLLELCRLCFCFQSCSRSHRVHISSWLKTSAVHQGLTWPSAA